MNRNFIFNSIFLAAIVLVITLQPYFMHGYINFYELGQYLPQINEVFHGKVLYRDMFIMRGPLEILMPLSMMNMLGKHVGVLNLYFYLGTVLTLIICVIFGLRVFSTKMFSYLFALVLTARTFPWSTFNTWGGIRFGWGILAILFAVNYLYRKKVFWLFLAGITSSLAFWTSFEIGAFSFLSIIIMIYVREYYERRKIRGALRPVTIYLAGNIIASAPFLTYLVLNRAFIPYLDMLNIVLNKMTKVYDHSIFFNSPTNFREFLFSCWPADHNFKYTLPFLFYIFTGIYLIAKIRKNKFQNRDICMIPVLIYGILLYKGAFRDIEGPQYRMALQPLLLAMFFYIEEIYGRVRLLKPAPGIKKAIVVFFILLIPVYSILFSFGKYTKRFFIFKELKSMVLNKTRPEIPYTGPAPSVIHSARAKGLIVPGIQAQEVDKIVSYLSSNTVPGEVVFTFPDLGAYNFILDRPPLGRFYTEQFSFMDQRWFHEMMENLKVKKPRFVICANEFSELENFRPTLGQYLDEVKDYLGKHYDLVAAYSSVSVLKIK